MIELRTPTSLLRIDERSGAPISFRAQHAPEQEFLVDGHAELPLFVVQYLDAEGQLRQVSSLEAERAEIGRPGPDGDEVSIACEGVGTLGLSAVATVRSEPDDPALRWELEIVLPRPALIVNVQYPYLVVRYDLGGTGDGTRLLRPYMEGQLYQSPRPHHFPPDSPRLWQLLPQNGDSAHYPGQTFAQFLAYYDDRAGLLLSCRDTSGTPKVIRPAHRAPGLRLGLAHAVGWTAAGRHRLGYEVALQAFRGDWYDAAEIYREWLVRQPWALRPIAERPDLPGWLADSPFHTALRIQGELDAGPTETHPELTPFENALPLLDAVAARLDSPLVPIVMAWERAGPWVYPDCFPPVGGEESLRRLAEQVRARGWHLGSYSNGTRWSTAHLWAGYDGEWFFRENGGPESVCRTPDGRPWPSGWDQHWRPSYTACVGAERTRELLREYARRLLDDGLDWLQILDQNVGGGAFPCYADDHDHEPLPGPWMTERMGGLLDEVHALPALPGPHCEVVWAVEGPCAECHLPAFVICDLRLDPRAGQVPLYHYLCHDRILIQSIFARAPNPYFLLLKCARAFVLGEVLGACIGAGGRLQNWEPPGSEPWPEWDRPAGDQDAAHAMFRQAIALRRGVGRDFLVFGRLLRPVPASGIREVTWTHGSEANVVPAVAHACWRAADGRIAVALANWTDSAEPVALDLSALSPSDVRLRGIDGAAEPVELSADGRAALRLPPRCCRLLLLN